MPNILETRSLQRALLKYMISDVYILSTSIFKTKKEFFNSEERSFLFELVKKKFEDSRSLIDQNIFEFEVNSKIIEKNRDIYLTEWNLIKGEEPAASVDVIIDSLMEAYTARKLVETIGEVSKLIERGEVDQAISKIRERSVSIEHIKNAEKSVVEITDLKERYKIIKDKKENPEKYSGIKSGFNYFDYKTGGFFPSELIVIAAVTGVGKSTLLKQFAYNVIRQGKNVLHVTNEEHELQVQNKYDALISKIDYFKFKKGTLTDEEIAKWMESIEALEMPGNGKLLIKEIPMYSNIIEIEKAFFEQEKKGKRPDLIILDYLDHLSPILKAFSENDDTAKAVADCKGLSVFFNVPVIIATQSATITEQKQEKGKNYSKMDVYGSKRKVHSANILAFVIQKNRDVMQLRQKGGDREFSWQCDCFWKVQIAKNRDGENFEFNVKQHVKTGYVEELKTTSVEKIDELILETEDEPSKEIIVRKAPESK